MDALGNPVRWLLTGGQVADIDQAQPLLQGLHAAQVVADKGYDADALVMDLRERSMEPVIPPRRNRLEQRDYDRHVYKDRNLVERFFCRIKHFRRIATRYEKLTVNFSSLLAFVCSLIWLR